VEELMLSVASKISEVGLAKGVNPCEGLVPVARLTGAARSPGIDSTVVRGVLAGLIQALKQSIMLIRKIRSAAVYMKLRFVFIKFPPE
jgi:hypothetical protein